METKSVLYLFLLILLTKTLFSQQIGFKDSFNDSNLTSDPTWYGDIHKFEIHNEELRLNDSSKSSPTYLSTPSQSIYKASWEFRVRMDFAPSGSNYAKVFLVSDQQNLNNSLNGYFVRIGGQSGNVDDVSLYRMDGTSETILIDGVDGTVGTNPKVYIKVIRDSIGNWELFTDTSTSTNNMISEGTQLDTTYSHCNYFGIQCIYTSTRSDLFYFDDFFVIGELPIDSTPPHLKNIAVMSDSSIILHFSENVSEATALDLNNYTVNSGIGTPIAVQFKNDSSEIELFFSQKFINGKEYELELQFLKDKHGNSMNLSKYPFSYLVPEKASKEDIVINEILFNPRGNGADFVELFNRSNKIISMNNWLIANISNGEIASKKIVTNENLILKPKDYLVITDDKANIFWEYPNAIENKIIEIPTLPSYNNESGTVYLLDDSEEIIDLFSYHEDMHFELLNSYDGVSLERVNPYLPSNHVGNFHSASETEGFATPTYENSQYFTTQKFDGKVSVDPEIFSPDNDGFQDVLNINYSFSSAGNVANVTIFDRNGRIIKTIANNELLGNKGSLFWDGITDNFEKASLGVYIIYFETFNLDGRKQEFKKTCVVAGYLD